MMTKANDDDGAASAPRVTESSPLLMRTQAMFLSNRATESYRGQFVVLFFGHRSSQQNSAYIYMTGRTYIICSLFPTHPHSLTHSLTR
jgi:hypothetical protein